MNEFDGVPILQTAIRQAACEVGIVEIEELPVQDLVLEIRRRSEITYDVLAQYIERHNAYRGFARWYDLRCRLGRVDEASELYCNQLDSRAEESRKVLLRHLYQAVLPEPDANLHVLHS